MFQTYKMASPSIKIGLNNNKKWYIIQQHGLSWGFFFLLLLLFQPCFSFTSWSAVISQIFIDRRGFILTPDWKVQTVSGLGRLSCGASWETGRVQRLHKCQVISLSPVSVGCIAAKSFLDDKGKTLPTERRSLTNLRIKIYDQVIQKVGEHLLSPYISSKCGNWIWCFLTPHSQN